MVDPVGPLADGAEGEVVGELVERCGGGQQRPTESEGGTSRRLKFTIIRLHLNVINRNFNK